MDNFCSTQRLFGTWLLIAEATILVSYLCLAACSVYFRYLQAMNAKKDRAKLNIMKASKVNQPGRFLSTGQSPDHV